MSNECVFHCNMEELPMPVHVCAQSSNWEMQAPWGMPTS